MHGPVAAQGGPFPPPASLDTGLNRAMALGGPGGPTVKTCFACAREIDDADRFCGHCGANQAISLAIRPEPEEPEELPLETGRRLRGGLILTALLILVVTGALGALAWTNFERDEARGTRRVTFNDIFNGIGEADEPAAEPSEEPVAETTEEPLQDETETEPAEQSQAATAAMLQPGRWQFTTQLVAISKVNPNDNFEINRQGIGSSEAHSLCVTPAAAEDPRAIAFPFPQGLGCSPSSFAMSNGSYSSRLTCSFPQFGGRRAVTANGRYSQVDTSVSVNLQVPAQVLEGDFEQPPEILMQYRIQGYLTGPC